MLITWLDKDDTQPPDTARKIVTDDDMNQIKNAVNTNAGAAFIASFFIFNEIPSGTINGINDTFTIENAPRTGTLMLYVDGIRLIQTVDFEITGVTITVGIPPISAIICDYML